jgi:Cu/Zn superoxide dismutase
MEWWASAEIVPFKGVRMSPVSIVFFQAEGSPTRARSEESVQRLRPGTYHLVVHTRGDCGSRASSAGPPLDGGTTFAPIVVPRKGPSPAVASDDLPFALAGDDTVTGHALVLHADRHGRPGKPIACGLIVPDGH